MDTTTANTTISPHDRTTPHETRLKQQPVGLGHQHGYTTQLDSTPRCSDRNEISTPGRIGSSIRASASCSVGLGPRRKLHQHKGNRRDTKATTKAKLPTQTSKTTNMKQHQKTQQKKLNEEPKMPLPQHPRSHGLSNALLTGVGPVAPIPSNSQHSLELRSHQASRPL